MLDTWKERRDWLIRFQKELLEKFPDEDYNVFVFGSYVREDFNPEQSDIDMIVYCNDFMKRTDIVQFSEKFFQSRGWETDILEYYFIPEAYIYVVGIMNAIQMTDYYPQELKYQLYVIAKNYSRFLEEQAVKKNICVGIMK